MIERKRLRKQITEKRLDYMQAYCIDSIKENETHYIIDRGKMAIVRHDDIILWDIPETLAAANIFIDPIKREILSIYEDLKDLDARGRVYGG